MKRSRFAHSLHKATVLMTAISAMLCATQDARAELVEITQKKSQKVIKVEVVKLTDSKLTFKLKSGKQFTVDIDTLTGDSVSLIRATIDAQAKLRKGESAAINKAIGHELFEGRSLWNEAAEEVASRLNWPRESSTTQSSSFRYYTAKDYQFLGAHPYCATLYGGEGGTTTHLSIVFANKGDFGSTVGSGEDHFDSEGQDEDHAKSLDEAITLDAKRITESLTESLGEPKKQYYGEKEDRRKVSRWDHGDHSILLSKVDDEYTSLLIVAKSNADLAGKVDFVKDSDLRVIVAKNVVKEDNGDVLIKNIPMVDQGPKGYCAPATFERAMRYMLVPADMYLLATAATTQEGTNTRKLAESCKRIVRSKARRIKDLDLKNDLKVKLVKKHINKGVPILWQMRSLKSYNKLVNTRTREREKVTDYEAWKETVTAEAEELAPRLENNMSNHHICMIIGYNEETNEIAVSDSWGERYELRWVHIDLAKAVTNPGGFVIDL